MAGLAGDGRVLVLPPLHKLAELNELLRGSIWSNVEIGNRSCDLLLFVRLSELFQQEKQLPEVHRWRPAVRLGVHTLVE